MALRVSHDEKSGSVGLRVTCDECGAEIRDADDGAIIWPAADRDAGICFVHNLCRRRLERRRGGCWESDSPRNLPIRLAAALALPIETSASASAIDYVLRGRLDAHAG
jgi:hypothetical protein